MSKGTATVLVLGAGSWGTALGMVLARNGHAARLWDSDQAHMGELARARANERHLPGTAFPELLGVADDIRVALGSAENVVIAVPGEGLRDVLGIVREAAPPGGLRLCLASKGLEPGTAALNHEVAMECLGEVPVAVLSGPSFAREVAAGLPTAVTIASTREDTASAFADCFHGDAFRVYTHDDVIGVEVGGAVKNVMAIAAGIADGLGFGANTRAALVTRGLAEIMRLGLALGGRRETFMGLAGLGDLVLTCTDDQSRNRRLGLALAAGETLPRARDRIGQAIEGVRTAGVVCGLARSHGIEMPICEQVQAVLSGQAVPRDAVQALLSRERKPELAG